MALLTEAFKLPTEWTEGCENQQPKPQTTLQNKNGCENNECNCCCHKVCLCCCHGFQDGFISRITSGVKRIFNWFRTTRSETDHPKINNEDQIPAESDLYSDDDGLGPIENINERLSNLDSTKEELDLDSALYGDHRGAIFNKFMKEREEYINKEFKKMQNNKEY